MSVTMSVRIITYALCAFTLSQTVLGLTVAENNKRGEVKRWFVSSRVRAADKGITSNVRFEVCAVVNGTAYVCEGDQYCCLPGNPLSRCCPLNLPICVANLYCTPLRCQKQCSEHCCKIGESCCGGQQCCTDEAPCCKNAGTNSCCDKNTQACCDEYGCVAPCESHFDAIGCQLIAPTTSHKEGELDLIDSGESANGNLYRILRPDEDPTKGLVAKDPSAKKTVLSHVNCGGRPNYKSQYISATTSLDVAKYYKKVGEKKGFTGLRIAEIGALPPNCIVVDLTNEANRNKYLGNAVCKIFAKKSMEVLLQSDEPIPYKVIELKDATLITQV